jgi:RNA polymerase sigma-70 factor (ECF subfamily)
VAAFMSLLKPLQGQLECYCRRVLKDHSGVEDVLQTAVMIAFAQFDGYAEGTNFRAWIYAFVVNEVRNCNRKTQRSPTLRSEFPSEPDAGSQELQPPADWVDYLAEHPDFLTEHLDEAVAHALDRLTQMERIVLLLWAIVDFTSPEIHRLLSIPVGSVTTHLSRARRKMSRALVDYR